MDTAAKQQTENPSVMSRQEAINRIKINRLYRRRESARFVDLAIETKRSRWISYKEFFPSIDFEAFCNQSSRVRDVDAPIPETSIQALIAGAESVLLW